MSSAYGSQVVHYVNGEYKNDSNDKQVKAVSSLLRNRLTTWEVQRVLHDIRQFYMRQHDIESSVISSRRYRRIAIA